jgi:hypothetical protein
MRVSRDCSSFGCQNWPLGVKMILLKLVEGPAELLWNYHITLCILFSRETMVVGNITLKPVQRFPKEPSLRVD